MLPKPSGLRCWTINGMRACKSYTFWLLEACVHPQDANWQQQSTLVRTVLEPEAAADPTRAKGGEVRHEWAKPAARSRKIRHDPHEDHTCNL